MKTYPLTKYTHTHTQTFIQLTEEMLSGRNANRTSTVITALVQYIIRFVLWDQLSFQLLPHSFSLSVTNSFFPLSLCVCASLFFHSLSVPHCLSPSPSTFSPTLSLSISFLISLLLVLILFFYHTNSSWRVHFSRTVAMKFNCFFLMPFLDDFPGYLVGFLIICLCILRHSSTLPLLSPLSFSCLSFHHSINLFFISSLLIFSLPSFIQIIFHHTTPHHTAPHHITSHH